MVRRFRLARAASGARSGAALAFEDSADAGAPVVFVHGWQADRSVWTGVIAALGERVRAIAVDLRGSGDSGAVPGPYTLERFAADLAELIASLGVAPAVVVGHSMGATAALRLAVDAPAMVRALVLIAPVPASGGGFSAKGEAYLRATAGDPAAVRVWLARTLADPAGAVLDRLCAAAAKMPRDAALESFSDWAHADFADATRAIAAPALVIAPENDAPERAQRDVAALLHNARCVTLPRASHYAIVERPGDVARLVQTMI